LPAGLRPDDFDYLQANNRYWSYLCGLASAEAFRGSKDNSIAYRDSNTDVLGDSGGFSYGSGSGEPGQWRGLTCEAEVVAAWRNSGILEKTVDWIERYASAGLTLDLPLWAARPVNSESPFHLCSAMTLLALSMEHVQYLLDRKSAGRLKRKYLNVLQGDKEADEEVWYQQARQYRLDGWSFAGGVGTDGGPYRIIRRLLTLRDDGLLGSGLNWVHLLKQTQLRWAPVLTAMQRGIQRSIGAEDFKITYDSSTPYQEAGKRERFVEAPALGPSLVGWHFKYHKFPTTFGVATAAVPLSLATATCTAQKCTMCQSQGSHLDAPLLSPIAQLLTIQDLLERKGNLITRRGSVLADEVLINHNVFTVVEGIIRANEAVFSATPNAPQELIDAAGMVADICNRQSWHTTLTYHRTFLEKAVAYRPSKNVL